MKRKEKYGRQTIGENFQNKSTTLFHKIHDINCL